MAQHRDAIPAAMLPTMMSMDSASEIVLPQ